MENINIKKEQSNTRRGFLKITAVAAAAGAIAAHLWIAVQYLLGSPSGKKQHEWKIGKPEDFDNGITFVSDANVFILRDGNKFKALSSKCTHLGCTLKKVQSDSSTTAGKKSVTEFHCPCHGSKFNAKGERIAGPGKKSLQYFHIALSQDGKELMVNNDMPVASEYFTLI